MSLIPGYPAGSDITLLDTVYQYPKRRKDGKKGYDPDILLVLFRDNITGVKKIVEIENPDYIYYISKEGKAIDNAMFFIEQEYVDKVTVKYSDLLKDIAERTGNLDFFYGNIKNGDRENNNRLHSEINEIFNSDMDINDNFRLRFSINYKNSTYPIAKSYFDIEADTINMENDFPELGECPVNAITYISDKGVVHTFLLRNKRNPQIAKFESEVAQGKILPELKEFCINHVGGYKYASRIHKIADFEYKMHFYDEDKELDLIADFFRLIHLLKPDFVLAWNASFDIPYLMERITILGGDVKEICCHPDVKNKVARYYIDQKNKNKPELRGDFYTISGYSMYADQMMHFASRRKGQSAFERHGLDYIGEKVAKVRKLDYHHITNDIAKLPWLNYHIFVFYNVMDTIVQHCIENKINDIDYVFNKCLVNNTRYHKCHRQSVYLTNRTTYEFQKDGYIIGNNHNRNSEKPKEKFPGAMVGDPRNNTDYAKIKINGVAVNLADNVDDFDYTSLYPSITIQNNIAPNTQEGRILIDQKVHDKENRFGYSKYSRGGAFLEDYQSHNFIEFCSRWLHFGGYREVIEDIEEYFKTHRSYGRVEDRYDDIAWITPGGSTPLATITGEFTVTPLATLDPESIDYTPILNYIQDNAHTTIDSFEHKLRRIENEKFEDEELIKTLGLDDLQQESSDGEVIING